MRPWDVSEKDVNNLNAEQLVYVTKELLLHAIRDKEVPVSAVSLTNKVDAPDGGIDILVEWTDGPVSVDFIPSRLSMFQCKATKMSKKGCKTEILKGNTGNLKSLIAEKFDKGGHYILICKASYSPSEQLRLKQGFIEGLDEAKREDITEDRIHILCANQIAALINQNKALAIHVRRICGRKVPFCRDFAGWSEEWLTTPHFQLDDKLSKHWKEATDTISTERKTCRIVGLPGVGKTRFAYEIINAMRNNSSAIDISKQAIYFDCSIDGLTIELLQYLELLVAEKSRQIIITDNCNSELHNQMQSIIKKNTSRISLVTIDNELERTCCDTFIHLLPYDIEDISRMIKKNFPVVGKDADRISEFSGGYPGVAVRIATSYDESTDSIAELNDEYFIRRLVWGRGEDNNEQRRVLAALSLFESFPYKGGIDSELEFIANEMCYSDARSVREIIQDFIVRGIIEKKNDSIWVSITPVALKLANNWWERISEEEVNSIVNKLSLQCRIKFFKRARLLHTCPAIKRFFIQMISINGRFATLDTLSSKEGAFIFSQIAELIPEEAVKSLSRVLKGCSAEELPSSEAGSYIVGILGKLSFLNNTYEEAGILLIKFACSKEEKTSSSASEYFLRLFPVLAADTQVEPRRRIQLLRSALAVGTACSRILVVKAISEALRNAGFYRFLGNEILGSRPAVAEWKPSSEDEVINYWREAVILLHEIVQQDADALSEAKKCLEDHIISLVRNHLSSELVGIISW